MAGVLKYSISLPTRPLRQHKTTTASSIWDDGSTSKIAMTEDREGDDIYWDIVKEEGKNNLKLTNSWMDLYQVDSRTQKIESIGQGPQGKQEKHPLEPERWNMVEANKRSCIAKDETKFAVQRVLNTASLSARQLEVETESWLYPVKLYGYTIQWPPRNRY